MTQSIAVIGLGTMGGRAAAAFAAAGHHTTGYDPAPAAREAAAQEGVVVHDTLAAAVSDAALIVVSVPLPEHLLTVAQDLAAHAAAGATVIDISTVDPQTAREVAQVLRAAGVAFGDAPVLGRPAGCGNWTLVLGAEPDVAERVTPLLVGTIAKAVVPVGAVGAGSVVKLANNLMFGAINAVTAEAIELCAANGVDPGLFVETVADSGAATVSNLFKDVAPRMVSGDFAPIFALGLLAKDNRLALEVARAAGGDPVIAEAVHRANAAGLAQGLGEQDSAALRTIYRKDGDSTP